VTDQPETSSTWTPSPVGGEGRVTADDGSSVAAANESVASSAIANGPAPAHAADRPEIAVGAAFAGGFVLALILKRLAR
jgi:hypothetical protein